MPSKTPVAKGKDVPAASDLGQTTSWLQLSWRSETSLPSCFCEIAVLSPTLDARILAASVILPIQVAVCAIPARLSPSLGSRCVERVWRFPSARSRFTPHGCARTSLLLSRGLLRYSDSSGLLVACAARDGTIAEATFSTGRAPRGFLAWPPVASRHSSPL